MPPILDAEIDSLCELPDIADPPMPPTARLWTWLCDRVPMLRRYRGTQDRAQPIAVPPERKAELLAMLCDRETREAVLALLAPGIRGICDTGGRE